MSYEETLHVMIAFHCAYAYHDLSFMLLLAIGLGLLLGMEPRRDGLVGLG
jgi:hypothetical protein